MVGNDRPDTADGKRGGNVAEADDIRSLLAEAHTAGVARLDAEVLLSGLLGRNRAWLAAFAETPVEPLPAAMYRVSLARRAAGEPVAYITGVREFWSLPITVGPGVLVPRPETELLVERCLALFDDAPRRIADLGTGSLAIAAALARQRPAWRIVATDQSPEALDIAAANRSRLGVSNIELRQGDWCAALGDDTFDVIVSNPPYIAPDDPALAALAHEPQGALVAGDEGFADLLAIAACARDHLREHGVLLLEHGSTQAGRLAIELVRLGYARVVCHRDLAGLDRVTEAQR